MAIYYFDDVLGSDSNGGTLPSNAWRSMQKFNATTFAAADIILFRRGGVWYGQGNINDNGSSGSRITLDDWGDGSEKYNKPIFSNPDPITNNPICLEVNADYISVYDIEFRDAKQAGIYIYQTNDNNIIERCHFTNVGRGVYIKGNSNQVRYCTGHALRMARNVGDSSDAGGLFVVFQRNSNAAPDTCDGNKILYCFVILAKAPSVQFTNDGVLYEIFGGVTNYEVAFNIIIGCKGMAEYGGDTALTQTTSGGRIHHNLVINCYGIIAYFNDPADNFFVDVSDTWFFFNTFLMADRSSTAMYFAGNWTGSGKVTYKNNVWRGKTTFIATNGTTNLNTIMTHTYNRYDRYDGSTALGTGYTLGTGESNGPIGFVNEAAGDYRITAASAVRGAGVAEAGYTTDIRGNTMASPPSMGAFEYKAAARNIGASVRKPLKLPTDQSNGYIVHCNDIKGGRHIYDSPLDMWAIPSAKKLQGMDCYLTDYQQEWRLDDPDLYNWTLKPQYDPMIRSFTALIQDVKAQNTDSGQGTAAQWNTRTLNEITYDDGLDVGLASNVITIRRAGTYEFRFWVMNEKTNQFFARLFNVTANAAVPKGTSSAGWAGTSSSTNSKTEHVVQVTITGATDFRLENYYAVVNGTTATQSYGRPANVASQSEIYSGVYIRRLH